MLKKYNMISDYFSSKYGSAQYSKLFSDVEGYCMFIGYPRSGHSLVGSLLDAHPNMVFAHELDALKYINSGFSKAQIYYLILENSRNFTSSGRRWRGYSYEVPNQWQGKFKKLRIIGDKKGGRSTRRFGADPTLLEVLRRIIDSDLKFIHVIRNPYDNISRIFIRGRVKYGGVLANSIPSYFELSDTIVNLKKGMNDKEMLDVRLETFIQDPTGCLRKICAFLGVDASGDYLDDCASIVFKTPKKSRHDVEWNHESIDEVKRRMKAYPFLKGYSFES